jgi:hypothetical protein
MWLLKLPTCTTVCNFVAIWSHHRQSKKVKAFLGFNNGLVMIHPQMPAPLKYCINISVGYGSTTTTTATEQL